MSKRQSIILGMSFALVGFFPLACNKINSPTLPGPGQPTPMGTQSPVATTTPMGVVSVTGNLDSTQRADQTGGVLDVGTAAAFLMPFTVTPLNGNKAIYVPRGPGQAIHQVADFASPLDSNPMAFPNHTEPIQLGGMTRLIAVNSSTNPWATGVSPACSVVKTVRDSDGVDRQISILFYQVNDLGTAGVNPPPPASQVLYAWYAFDTTGGTAPSNAGLLGGTGLIEGHPTHDQANSMMAIPVFMRWDIAGPEPLTSGEYWGDFLYFNNDGSSASEGGLDSVNGIGFQVKPRVYLAVTSGIPVSDYASGASDVFSVELNFGTAGMLGFGGRDGITCDPSSCNIH